MPVSENSLKLKKSPWRIFWDLFWTIFLIIVAIIWIRLATWENDYYNRMEGSERAAVISVDNSTLDESDVTDDDKNSYSVRAGYPRFLSIPALSIDRARILEVSITTSGAMATPNNIFDVGWYDGSGLPGSGSAIVINGHNGGPTKYGVFKTLPNLNQGDEITIEVGGGQKYSYLVQENSEIPLDEADSYMRKAFTNLKSSAGDSVETLTLISCSGEWSTVYQTYLSRQFVRATLES